LQEPRVGNIVAQAFARVLGEVRREIAGHLGGRQLCERAAILSGVGTLNGREVLLEGGKIRSSHVEAPALRRGVRRPAPEDSAPAAGSAVLRPTADQAAEQASFAMAGLEGGTLHRGPAAADEAHHQPEQEIDQAELKHEAEDGCEPAHPTEQPVSREKPEQAGAEEAAEQAPHQAAAEPAREQAAALRLSGSGGAALSGAALAWLRRRSFEWRGALRRRLRRRGRAGGAPSTAAGGGAPTRSGIGVGGQAKAEQGGENQCRDLAVRNHGFDPGTPAAWCRRSYMGQSVQKCKARPRRAPLGGRWGESYFRRGGTESRPRSSVGGGSITTDPRAYFKPMQLA